MIVDFNCCDICDSIDSFNGEQYLIVKRKDDGFMNIINSIGVLLMNKWYPYIGRFRMYEKNKKILGIVKREDKLKNIINEEGKIICNDWFVSIGPGFIKGIISVLNKNHLYNLVRFDGSYVQEKWFEEEELDQMICTYKDLEPLLTSTLKAG